MKMDETNTRLVEIYKIAGEAAAQIIKGKLEANGIPVMLRSVAAPSVHAFTLDGLGEYRIMVPETMAEEAKQLIED